MCGIVALYSPEPRTFDREVVVAMRDSIAHRGPDDAGLFVDDRAALGHRRLSIIDLEGGQQPMCDDSGAVWVCFNGEIYNFPQLRRELVERGYPFKTHSDTEVLLALYRLEGEDALPRRLNGIFAFALWDANRRRMFLVRDRLGIKPLYWWRGSDGLVVAGSEIKALLRHPQISAGVHEKAIAEYLAFRQVSGGRTLFQGIEMIAPGEMVVLQDRKIHRRTYWALPTGHRQSLGSRGRLQAKEQLEELLRDATHMQMISDVPLGTFNSGGVDSSLMTSYVAEKAGEHLNTFCIGLEDPDFDERPYAELVAQQYQTQHHNLVVTDHDYAEHLPRVVWHHDEPLTHPNTLPIYLLCQLAKDLVTVAITGEGCDEFFGGYPRYRLGAALETLGPLGRGLGKILAVGLPVRSAGRLGKILNGLKLGPEGAIAQTSRYVPDTQLRDLLTLDPAEFDRHRQPPVIHNGNIVAAMLEFDQRNYLLPILNRLDKASMAFGLEARVPFLDHRLLEFAATVPTSLKVSRSENKILVKDLADDRLPEPVVHRKKSGLAMPLENWLRDPAGMGRYLDMLLEPRSRQRGYLRGESLQALVEEHRAARRNHAELLWGLLNLELWQRVMIEGDGF